MSDLPVETFRLTQGLSPSRLSDGMEEEFEGQEEVRNREEAAIGKDGLSARQVSGGKSPSSSSALSSCHSTDGHDNQTTSTLNDGTISTSSC